MATRREMLVGTAAVMMLRGVACGEESSGERNAWVARVLERMLSVRPGQTRGELLKVFETEGGLSTGVERTYVSRDCRYFKVNVAFHAVGRPDRDANGRVTLDEDARDVIVSLSPPYLQFSIAD